jgi:DNA polymerase III delta prime subunit
MMNANSRWVVILLLLLTLGCVSAPRATVELAEIADQQIAEMHASHEKFVRLYYAKLRDDVDRFMEQKWIPQFLSNVVEGKGEQSKQFRTDLDKAYKLVTLDWETVIQINGIKDEDVKQAVRSSIKKLTTQENAVLAMVLLDFSKAAQEQVNKQRKLLIRPIDQQEAYVLDQLRMGYADLLRSSAAIKGYLASVAKLVEQREAIYQKLGVLETQRKIVDAATRLSDGAVITLNATKDADKGITEFLTNMGKAMDELKKIIDRKE